MTFIHIATCRPLSPPVDHLAAIDWESMTQSVGVLEAIVAVAIILFAGILFLMLRKFQTLRTGLALELKRELQAQSEPSLVNVQQPLEIKKAVTYVTQEVFDNEIHQIKTQIEQLRLSEESRVQGINAQFAALNQRLNELPKQVLDLLNTTKQYHQYPPPAPAPVAPSPSIVVHRRPS